VPADNPELETGALAPGFAEGTPTELAEWLDSVRPASKLEQRLARHSVTRSVLTGARLYALRAPSESSGQEADQLGVMATLVEGQLVLPLFSRVEFAFAARLAWQEPQSSEIVEVSIAAILANLAPGVTLVINAGTKWEWSLDPANPPAGFD
jgi:hypothetical protein